MRLQPSRHIIERARIRDVARHAREIGNLVRQRIPLATPFVGWGVRWWRNGMTLFNQGVQVDHLVVVVQKVEGDLPGDAHGEGRHRGEYGTSRHVGCALVWRNTGSGRC